MCGYCEPGFIMAIAALLEASPAPSEEQIAALPNICRCGAYPRIRKAIARAAQAPRRKPPRQRTKLNERLRNGSAVGKPARAQFDCSTRREAPSCVNC